MASVAIGDRVAYRAAFLRNIGMVAGDMGHARGTLADIEWIGKPGRGQELGRVQWEDGADLPEWILTANLCRVGGPGFCTT